MAQVGDVITSPSGSTYKLDKRLGSGTYGTVYKATDQFTKAQVAIKVSQLRAANDPSYINEITAYSALSKSPNCQQYIVCLYDDFRTGLTAYEVQELMDGDLEKFKADAPQRVTLLLDLYAGMAYIHNNGFAHQDIKPANVLRKGTVFKFGDLGLACANNRPPIFQCTETGSPLYVAPELFPGYGTGRQISVRRAQVADIWSLGVTIYQIIMGTLPFADDKLVNDPITRRWSLNVTQADIIPLQTVRPSGLLPAANLNALVNAMLRVNPDERPTAEQLLTQLNAVLTTALQPAVAVVPAVVAARPRVPGCKIEDDPEIAGELLAGVLNNMKVPYDANATPAQLCEILKENYTCLNASGQNVSKEDLIEIARIYGLDSTGSKAKVCKTISKALAAQNIIDKKRVATTILNALKQATDARLKGDLVTEKKLETGIVDLIRFNPAMIDRSYLTTQASSLDKTITQIDKSLKYNQLLFAKLNDVVKLIPAA